MVQFPPHDKDSHESSEIFNVQCQAGGKMNFVKQWYLIMYYEKKRVSIPLKSIGTEGEIGKKDQI